MPTASIQAVVGGENYPVYISDHALDGLRAFLSSYKKGAVFFVYDAHLLSLNSDCCAEFRPLLEKYPSLQIDGGIDFKSVNVVVDIAEAMFDAEIPRDGVLVAVGGGVIGDVAGFAASIFQRGIDLVHVPTTATSMIDSAIGGKTGANLCGQVNLVGTYFQPSAVFMDIRFLLTLEFRDLISGFAEALKMAIISDYSKSTQLAESARELISLKTEPLFELIRWSVGAKLSFVSSDVTEKSVRLFLNYGHTFGQAFEAYYGISHHALRHGEAVSLGMMCAARAAVTLEIADRRIVSEHRRLLQCFSLPTHLADLELVSRPPTQYLEEAIYNDKKRISDGPRLVLCKEIGAPRIIVLAQPEILADAFSVVTQ